MFRLSRHLLLTAAVLMFIQVAAFGSQGQPDNNSQATTTPGSNKFVAVEKGLRLEFSIMPAGEGKPAELSIKEGDYADVQFRITDETTGAPVTPLEPAVWIDLLTDARENLSCRERIQLYLQGTLNYQADIDLTKFFILAFNNDQTISVIDPILGISGYTQLYAMVVLRDRGEDWVMSGDGKSLYVTMPGANQVAVVDLENFKVVDNLEAGSNPVRIALQPDGRYLWVGNDARGSEGSGVTVIDLQKRRIAAQIATGAGHHEMAFTGDSLWAFVTNTLAGTLSIIDTQKLEKVKDLATGKNPVAVAFSAKSKNIYVGTEAEGHILVVDTTRREFTKTIPTRTGLINFRLDPTGRWGFAANSLKNQVDILDTSNNELVHTLNVGQQPHQFAFTDTYAYVRSLGAPEIHLIRLSQLDKPASLNPQRIPVGSKSPGEIPNPSVANAISPTGEWSSVVVANPADRYVYYYMEGMVAPMGSFPAYGRIPRAVAIVDRSIRETEKGVYSARIRVPKAGAYNVAFVIDSPWVDQCFTFTAEADPRQKNQNEKAPPKIEFLTKETSTQVGQEFKLVFSLKIPTGETLEEDIGEVLVLATRPPGYWQTRKTAKRLPDGNYEVILIPDQPGLYIVSFAIPSLKLDFTRLAYTSFKATDRQTAKEVNHK